MRSRLAATVATIAISAMSPVPTFADSQSETLPVFTEIQRSVTYDAYSTIFDNINVSIDATGVITLTGSVTNPFKKDHIEDGVNDVDGVLAINNQVEVLPVSRFDNRLRYQIARAIYGHPSLNQYIRTRPSIHIIVKRGHVTLVGVVNNKNDATIALMQARQGGAFSVTNELKTSLKSNS